MLATVLEKYYPQNWEVREAASSKYTEINLSSSSVLYAQVKRAMKGVCSNNIEQITRVENPYLYGFFLLKEAEYKARGVAVTIQELYHDTAKCNIPSILSTNLDWRYVRRNKFGTGVSFSPDTSYANRYSSMENGVYRAMIVADVLVGRSNETTSSTDLPRKMYDTNTGNRGKVYVKFYDNEFYPKYVIYYNI